MSARITPEERAALPVARAALESKASAYGISDTIVFALGSAGLLQSPETAAEMERLRAQVAELRAERSDREDELGMALGSLTGADWGDLVNIAAANTAEIARGKAVSS